MYTFHHYIIYLYNDYQMSLGHTFISNVPIISSQFMLLNVLVVVPMVDNNSAQLLLITV